MKTPQFRLLICACVFAVTSLTAGEPVKDLKAKEVAAEIEKDDKIVILDIRTPEEYKEGHITGAQNIDFNGDDFDAAIDKLDRDKTYVVHCRSGGRSGRSMAVFKDKGFKSILHMIDGMNGWTEAGLKTEK